MTRSNEAADRFTRDVDRILRDAGRMDGIPPDSEYREDLVLAAELSATDFGADSRVRESLRRRLMSGETARVESTRDSLLWTWRRRPGLAAALATMLAAMVLVVAQPTLRAAVVDPVFRYLKRLVVGEQTQVVVADSIGERDRETILAEHRRALEAGEKWSTETAVGRTGGEVPEGRPPVIRTYNSLGLARSASAFPLREPAELPERYRFRRALIAPNDDVILWYTAPGERLTLTQRLHGENTYTTVMSVGSDSSLEEASVNGRPAAWLNNDTLAWQDDRMSFNLGGNTLTLDEALRIAESVR